MGDNNRPHRPSSHHAPPHSTAKAGERGQPTGGDAESRGCQCHDPRRRQREAALDEGRFGRTAQEIALQNGVGDGGLHLHADEPRIVWCRHQLLRAQRGGADEHQFVAERAVGGARVHHIGRRHVREGAPAAAEAQQQVAASVERQRAIADRQRRRVGVDGAQLAGLRLEHR
jgi:hypothetical protein